MSDPWGVELRECSYCYNEYPDTGGTPEYLGYHFCSDECFEAFKTEYEQDQSEQQLQQVINES
jgi:hypothetical protein